MTEHHDFQLDPKRTVFYGICNECRKKHLNQNKNVNEKGEGYDYGKKENILQHGLASSLYS